MLKLTGNSGCKIEIVVENNTPVIVKSGGNFLDLDYSVLASLSTKGIKTPEYYSVSPDRVTMRYLDGLSIVDYITQDKDLDKLIEFCKNALQIFEQNSSLINIDDKLHDKFADLEQIIDCKKLNFKLYKLYEQLPKELPCGLCHGDLTFENIIYWNDEFYLIDANYTNLNSLAFDSAKIRQDSQCRWFIRNQPIDNLCLHKINYLNEKIKQLNMYANNDYLLMFMLLRVVPYCKIAKEQDSLIDQINLLWT